MSASTVLVTGAASGIGAAVAIAAAREGARVAALDMDRARLDEVLVAARGEGASGVLGIPTDVSDEVAVEQALARCIEELGVPSYVLANAGVELNGPAHEMALDRWRRLMDVNLTGVFLTVRHAIRGMLKAGVGGSVVCTSSPAAFVGFAGGGNAAYAASKGGISAMVRSLAIDYANAGIRVNAVVPGAIDTPMLTCGTSDHERSVARARIVADAAAQIPTGRLGTPAEVAAAVLWLWSDAASYVTGSHLMVDGGLMAKSANTF
jgi:NAD(P)-dependent dehydrogenase (short-subunit alcohol dehydrogenase family)